MKTSGAGAPRAAKAGGRLQFSFAGWREARRSPSSRRAFGRRVQFVNLFAFFACDMFSCPDATPGIECIHDARV